MELTEYEKAILWQFFRADLVRWSRKLYVFYGDRGYRWEIKESTALSLADKGVIKPRGLTIKEWKVQIALGVAEDVELILTESGAWEAIAHTGGVRNFAKNE